MAPMALARYIHCALRAVHRRHRDRTSASAMIGTVSRVRARRNETDVRVVLAGGTVELYTGEVGAFIVMERHPGLCLARPEIFRRPIESLVGPWERLLPGEKFYLVPRSTVKKLCRDAARGEGSKGGEESGASSEDSVCANCLAKEFYVERERWMQCFLKRFGRGEEQQQQQQRKLYFRGCNKVRMRQGLLMGWKPSLASIEEVSP